jgi:hypothetical protein
LLKKTQGAFHQLAEKAAGDIEMVIEKFEKGAREVKEAKNGTVSV